MFGRKKNDPEIDKAQKLGQKVGAAVVDDIDNYCSRIVFFQASRMLRAFAAEIEELPEHDPFDDEANKERVFRVTEFIVRSHDGLAPLKQQLSDQMNER